MVLLKTLQYFQELRLSPFMPAFLLKRDSNTGIFL